MKKFIKSSQITTALSILSLLFSCEIDVPFPDLSAGAARWAASMEAGGGGGYYTPTIHDEDTVGDIDGF